VSFPSTPILDTFNRANEGPPPSANWASSGYWIASSNNLKVVSNQCVPIFANGESYWSNTTFGPDSEAYCSVTGSTESIHCVRLSNPGHGTSDGYFVDWEGGKAFIERMDNGSATLLGALIAVAFGSGDVLGVSAVGSSISAHRNGSSIGTRTDATYNSAGFVGLLASAAVDDFGGGTYVESPRRFTNTLGIRSPVRYDVR